MKSKFIFELNVYHVYAEKIKKKKKLFPGKWRV